MFKYNNHVRRVCILSCAFFVFVLLGCDDKEEPAGTSPDISEAAARWLDEVEQAREVENALRKDDEDEFERLLAERQKSLAKNEDDSSKLDVEKENSEDLDRIRIYAERYASAESEIEELSAKYEHISEKVEELKRSARVAYNGLVSAIEQLERAQHRYNTRSLNIRQSRDRMGNVTSMEPVSTQDERRLLRNVERATDLVDRRKAVYESWSKQLNDSQKDLAVTQSELEDAKRYLGQLEIHANIESRYIAKLEPFQRPFRNQSEQISSSVVTISTLRGHGSGFIICSNGYALTCAHVIGNDSAVKVMFPNSADIPAEVVSASSTYDVALIKIKDNDLPALPINMQQVAIGDEVYAIGSPLAEVLSTTVSKGVVSSFRNFGDINYIQSDVNVLPGNSGGPLLDSSGNVIGICNSGIGSGLSLNFFTPIEDAFNALNIQIR